MSKPRQYNKVSSIIPKGLTSKSTSNSKKNCNTLIRSFKAKYNGDRYNSPSSSSISSVTFYNINIDRRINYFAIVCFKNSNNNYCNEYLYQVSLQTKELYSTFYRNSAGKAFWKYVNPHKKNLLCSPDF